MLTERRLEHGYCVDDVARGLVVTTREPEPEPATAALAATYQRFLANAQDADGGFRNRLGTDLTWQDEPSVTDCWGRALWGLGTAAARSPQLADEALGLFGVSAARRSPWTRAMGFAALGAAEVLTVHPDHEVARALLADAAHLIDPLGTAPDGPAADVALAGGPPALRQRGTPRDAARRWATCSVSRAGSARGLDMLEWLLGVETSGGHLSVTPARGWSLGRASARFRPAAHRGRSPGGRVCSGPRHHGRPPVGRRGAAVRRLVRGVQRHRDPR